MTTPPPARDTSAYSEEQFHGNYPPGMEHHYWLQARCILIADRLKRFRTTPKNILDIGCGPGFTVSHLVSKGYNCRGVDLGTPDLPEKIRDRVFTGMDFQKLDPTLLSEIDTVLILDVVEHLHDPVGFLSDVRRYLPNLRNAIITVPARQELWSNYDVYFGHVLRYEREQFRELLTQCELPPKELRYIFHTLYLPMRLALALGMRRKQQNTRPRYIPLHTLAAHAIYLEAKLLPGSWRGGSLLATVELPGKPPL